MRGHCSAGTIGAQGPAHKRGEDERQAETCSAAA